LEEESEVLIVAASVATSTADKATYIKNRAFDKGFYKSLITEFIAEYNKASRADIDNLVLDKLSNVLTGVQKRTKIRNLLYEMSKKDGSIYNASTSTANPVWMLSDSYKIGKDRD
jgi:ATP-dependent DNA helicase RecG